MNEGFREGLSDTLRTLGDTNGAIESLYTQQMLHPLSHGVAPQSLTARVPIHLDSTPDTV